MINRSGGWLQFLVCIAAAVGLVGLFFVPAVSPALLKLEHWTADWRTAWLSDQGATSHPDLAIVTIDLGALEPYPFLLPISRSLQADVVESLARNGARAIALDFYYTKPTIPADDDKLLRVFGAHKDRLILGVYENADALKPDQLAYQQALIETTQARVGFLNLNPGRDGVVRTRAAGAVSSTPRRSFSSEIADAVGRKQSTEPERISWLLRARDGSDAILKIRAQDLLDPASSAASRVKGRVVIVAGDLPYFDRHRTPLTISTGSQMIGAEIHAQMAAELIDGGRSYGELTNSQARIFLAALAAIGVVLGWRFRQRRFDFLDWRIVSIMVLACDALVFKFAHLVLPLTLAAFAWGLGVAFGTQLRGIISVLQFRRADSA